MATDPDVRRAVIDSLAGLTGRARTETVQRLATFYGVSPQTIGTWARQAGQRVRAARADRGRCKVSPQELETAAAMLLATKRLDGTIILPACDAVALLRRTGLMTTDASRSTVYRQLRERRLSARHLLKPTPFRYRATAHPNAEHQVDVTNCVQYFLDDQGLGERDIAMQLHKNHPAEFRKIKKELLRYAVVDHYSGAFFFQYCYATGETAQDTIEFLIRAWQPKGHAAYRFHGVPFRLFADRGSMARAKLSARFLRQMQVDLATHLPGNPRAKGLVEWLHKFLLRFEAQLKFQRPRNLAELNRWAFEYSIEWNCVQPYRTKTSEGQTRMQRWCTITPAQLRIPPDEAMLKRILRTGFLSRKVDGGGRFTFEGRCYHVPDPNGWGEAVLVAYNPYTFPAVEATWLAADGRPLGTWCLAPLTVRADGWLEDTATPGTIRRPAATETQRALPRLEQVANETFGVTWTGTGDKRRAEAPPVGAAKQAVFGHADLAEDLVLKPTPGTRHAPADPEAARRLTLMQLLGELADSLGRPLTPAENARVRQTWPEGVPVREIETVVQTIRGKQPLRPPVIEAGGSSKLGMEDDDADSAIAAG